MQTFCQSISQLIFLTRVIHFEDKNVHKQIHFFNKTILNIFHNYIPNKTIICTDRDPQWFNNEIRKILRKMRYSKVYN